MLRKACTNKMHNWTWQDMLWVCCGVYIVHNNAELGADLTELYNKY